MEKKTIRFTVDPQSAGGSDHLTAGYISPRTNSELRLDSAQIQRVSVVIDRGPPHTLSNGEALGLAPSSEVSLICERLPELSYAVALELRYAPPVSGEIEALKSEISTLKARLASTNTLDATQSQRLDGLDSTGVDTNSRILALSNQLQAHTADTSQHMTSGAFHAALGGYNGLFHNGSGQVGGGNNWGGLTRRTDTFPFGAQASFSHRGPYREWRSDEFMPVDSSFVYQIRASARYIKKTQASTCLYLGVVEFDVDGNMIWVHQTRRQAATDTALAQPLRVGDGKVFLASSANWDTLSPTLGYQRGLAFFNYADSRGYEYRRSVVPYTRHVFMPPAGLWDSGAVNMTEQSIALREPWRHANPRTTDGAWPAGTEVSASDSGATFSYCVAIAWRSGTTGATEWTPLVGSIGGTGAGSFLWRPGAANFKMLALLNHTGTSDDDEVALGNIYVDRTNLSRAQAGLS